MPVRWLSILILTLLPAGASAAEPGDADVTFFETKIRPLLVEKCFKCHSVQEQKHKGGLYLDSLPALLKGGESGPALVPGKPEQSKIIEAVSYKNADLQMPPKGRLAEAQAADLNEWIKRGAPWPKEAVAPPALSTPVDPEKKKRMAEHWAWQPVKTYAPPYVKNASWPANAIDAFILAKLDEMNLEPAPPAEKRVLIRRATLDLTGLPPTPEEVDAFLNDASADAFAKVVDRLLASPQYGERWGRHWLDVARYADSNGMDENHAYGNAFRYRDYVVAAFNTDLPYDQFVREQIAGDLMPVKGDRNATAQRQTATGFLALGPKVLAEPDPKKMEMDIVDEELDTAGRAFMGLTLGCCRCHDHKFDPIPTADYYSLAAIFKSTRIMENFKKVARWYERPLGTPEEIAARSACDVKIKAKKDEMDKLVKVEDERIVAKFRSDCTQYMLAAAETLRAEKPLSAEDAAGARKLNAADLAKWVDFLKKNNSPDHPLLFAWNELSKLPPEPFAASAAALAQRLKDTNAEKSKALAASFRTLFPKAPPVSLEELASGYGRAFAESEYNFQHNTPENAAKNAKDPAKTALKPFREVLATIKFSPYILRENETLYGEEASKKINAIQHEINLLEKSRPALDDAMGATEGEHLAGLRIHIRGNPQTLGEEVPKRFPAILVSGAQPKLDDTQSGRLEFANWLTRPEHPLTGRVMVNRVWRWHFASGLVNTPDNFGLLGEKPSHPELLDWLTAEFVGHGWSLKHLHRLMMLSSTYRMSVVANEKYERIDPENRLHWRMSRQRLEAEVLRDAVLAVSGDLDLKMGGTIFTAKNRDYVNNDSIRPLYELKRRSIYLPVIRNNVFDVFQAFDFPDPNVITGNRATTTVAPQALFMLNGKLMLDEALKFGQVLLRSKELDDAGRVRLAYQKAFSRPPTTEETARALNFVRQYAMALSKLEKPPAEADGKAKAWAGLCQVIFASNEFVYVE